MHKIAEEIHIEIDKCKQDYHESHETVYKHTDCIKAYLLRSEQELYLKKPVIYGK